MTRRGRILALAGALCATGLGGAMLFGSAAGDRLATRRFPPAVANPTATRTVSGGGLPGGPGVRLAFLGDVQRGIGDVARPLVEAVRREAPAVVVQGGDLVSHGELPYYGVTAAAFERAGLGVPMLVVPGNHDIEPDGVRVWEAGRRAFEERIGPRWWMVALPGSLPAGKVLLVVGLDDAVEPVSDAQLAWLDRTLGPYLLQDPAQAWILAIHKPPRSLDAPGAPVARGAEGLVQRLEAHPPLLVVSGHLHEDADVTVGGVRYVINAHGGDLDTRGPTRPASLLVVDVPAEGRPSLRRVPLERRSWLAVDLDRLWVRLWAERRRMPWLPWLAFAVAATLAVVAWRGRRPA